MRRSRESGQPAGTSLSMAVTSPRPSSPIVLLQRRRLENRSEKKTRSLLGGCNGFFAYFWDERNARRRVGWYPARGTVIQPFFISGEHAQGTRQGNVFINDQSDFFETRMESFRKHDRRCLQQKHIYSTHQFVGVWAAVWQGQLAQWGSVRKTEPRSSRWHPCTVV